MRSTRFVCDEVADDTGASGGGGGESDDSENGRAVSWLVHNLSDMERGSVEHERKMGGELGGSGGAEVGVGCGVELGSDGVTSGVEHDGGDVPVEHGDDASRPLQRSWSWMSRKAVDVERLRQRKGFLDFVRASMFLTVFLVMMSLHQSIGDVFELERAVKFERTERQWGEQALTPASLRGFPTLKSALCRERIIKTRTIKDVARETKRGSLETLTA